MTSSISIIDQNEFINLHEYGRVLRWRAQFLRNKIYWRELRKIQRQGFDDSKLLISFLEAKISLMKRINEVWQASPLTFGSSSPSSGGSTYHTVGDTALRSLVEHDETSLKANQDLAETIERQVLPAAREKILQHEKSASVLWDKGKVLLVAWSLQDQIVSTLYSSILTSSSTPRGTGTAARNDHWIALVRYYQATNKLKIVADQCNKHFRTLFLIAKDFENSRVSMVVRIAEQYLSKVMEMTQQFGMSTKSTIDGLKALPSSINSSQRSLADELERRVREESSEGGKFDALAAYQLQQRDVALNSSNVSSSYGVGWDGVVPSSQDLLRCASLRRMFMFSREEAGYISSTWTPILVGVTADGWLHLIKMIETDSSSPTTTTTVMSIASAFDLAINSNKQCYEDDISEPLDPNIISLEKKSILKNAAFAKLCEGLCLDDLDVGRDEIWSTAVDLFLKDSLNAAAVNGVETFMSMDLKQCVSVLRPSAITSENIVEITETVTVPGSMFSFSRTMDRKVALKARLQTDAIDLMSLLQAAKTSS